ncbi:hypothetical protein [Acidocella aminolytica]|uniref:hypothetical protein n=1 Tax=Acidocella aminolytica TaxID=33998 RepID=UPI001F520BB5|nr:hypothetical protein [Acidocella aminolytica]
MPRIQREERPGRHSKRIGIGATSEEAKSDKNQAQFHEFSSKAQNTRQRFGRDEFPAQNPSPKKATGAFSKIWNKLRVCVHLTDPVFALLRDV